MDDKIKDTINQLIDEFGLYEAKNMLGITFANIVKLSGQKIYTDTGMASEILYESINNGQLPIKYKEFEISTSSDGIAYWEGKFKTDRFLPDMVENISVMATPFWDGMKFTPVEADWYSLTNETGNVLIAEISAGESGNYYQQLDEVEVFSNVDDLFSWYKKVYLPVVYDIITNDYLPRLQQEMEDRLDENEGYNPMRESIVRALREETKTQEMKEGELTEKCWKGYTQKGMKTMFGKRYPNCVKKKKK